MKAMNPEMFWALALHLQRCGHQLKIIDDDHGHVTVQLASGDPFYGEDERTWHNFRTVEDAKMMAKSWGIYQYDVINSTMRASGL